MDNENMTPQTDYIRGLKAGVRLYAWWKDGTQYVGTCGTTLKHALERIDKEETADKSDYYTAGGK